MFDGILEKQHCAIQSLHPSNSSLPCSALKTLCKPREDVQAWVWRAVKTCRPRNPCCPSSCPQELRFSGLAGSCVLAGGVRCLSQVQADIQSGCCFELPVWEWSLINKWKPSTQALMQSDCVGIVKRNDWRSAHSRKAWRAVLMCHLHKVECQDKEHGETWMDVLCKGSEGN